MDPSFRHIDCSSFEQGLGISGIESLGAVQLESWNTVAAVLKNAKKKPMEQPIRKKLSPKKPISRKYRLGMVPSVAYENYQNYRNMCQIDRSKKDFYEYNDARAKKDDNQNDFSNAIAQNHQVVQRHQALHDHKDGHRNGVNPAPVPVFASYEVAKGGNANCNPAVFMNAVQDTNMKLDDTHPIFEGMKRSFAQMQIQSPTWPQDTTMTQDATFEPFIFGQSSASDESLVGDESPIKYQKIDDETSFPNNTFPVFEGFYETESYVKDWCARNNEVSLWSLLDSMDTAYFNQGGLHDADAKPMQHRNLIPAGLFCTAETTKQVPEYKVQEISQDLDRHVSQEAIFDTSMSTDTKAHDDSAGGPFSDSPAQFTRDLRSELLKIRGAIENVAAKPFGPDQARDRIHAGPFPGEKLFGIKSPLASSPTESIPTPTESIPTPTESIPKASSAGVMNSPRKNAPHQKAGHKKPGRRVRDMSGKVTHQLSDMSQASLLTCSPQSDVQFGLTVPSEWRHASLSVNKLSELYSDFDLLICKTANDFLVQQYHRGGVSDISINKVRREWDDQNRPPVKEFYFDQTTQRRLIIENRETIHFHSGLQGTTGLLLSIVLSKWKGIIAQMNLRTRPMSDPSIDKIIQDVGSVLQMLNAPPQAMRCYRAMASWVSRRLKLPRPTFPITRERGRNSRK